MISFFLSGSKRPFYGDAGHTWSVLIRCWDAVVNEYEARETKKERQTELNKRTRIWRPDPESTEPEDDADAARERALAAVRSIGRPMPEVSP